MKDVVKNKKIILIDDLIVCERTSKKLVKILKTGGAKEVYLRIFFCIDNFFFLHD